MRHLHRTGRNRQAQLLENFYQKLEESRIAMINQPHPRGFGDAVLRAADFTGEAFIVHAGDIITHPNHTANIQKLLSHWNAHGPAAALLYDESQHSEKYGVVIGRDAGSHIKVEKLLENQNPNQQSRSRNICLHHRHIHSTRTNKAQAGRASANRRNKQVIERGHSVHAIKLQEKTRPRNTQKLRTSTTVLNDLSSLDALSP